MRITTMAGFIITILQREQVVRIPKTTKTVDQMLDSFWEMYLIPADLTLQVIQDLLILRHAIIPVTAAVVVAVATAVVAMLL